MTVPRSSPEETTWVFCCGMIRSGSTLQYQMAMQLVETTGSGKALGYASAEGFGDLFARHGADGGLAVVKCHDWIPAAADLVRKGRGRLIYISRDLRDVAASMARKKGYGLRELLASRELQRAIENHHAWRACGDWHAARYEQVVNDLASEVNAIARHLGLAIEPAIRDRIAEDLSLDAQRSRIAARAATQDRRLGRMLDGTAIDSQTLLHADHITSGSAGGWRDSLGPLESAAVEYLGRRWLEMQGYRLYSPAWRRQLGRLRYGI